MCRDNAVNEVFISSPICRKKNLRNRAIKRLYFLLGFFVKKMLSFVHAITILTNQISGKIDFVS